MPLPEEAKANLFKQGIMPSYLIDTPYRESIIDGLITKCDPDFWKRFKRNEVIVMPILKNGLYTFSGPELESLIACAYRTNKLGEVAIKTPVK